MLVLNLQLPLVIVLYFENNKLKRTSCFSHTCAQNGYFQLILSKSITVVVVSRLDIRLIRHTLPESEAIAILYAMALESIVGFFIGCIKTIWRGSNILHAQLNKAS